MNAESIKIKQREYLSSNTQYGSYEIDMTSNSKQSFYLRIDGVEYTIPKLIFKKTIGIGNHHDGISDYIFDLTHIGITNFPEVVQTTPESLIYNTLKKIAEYIQQSNNNNLEIDLLLIGIKKSVESLLI